MYKLDPNIINLTPSFDFQKNGYDFLDFIIQLEDLPNEQIDLSATSLELAMGNFPYDYFEERNIKLGPFMDYYMTWLSQLNYNDTSMFNLSAVETSPQIFCTYHNKEFCDDYKNVLAFSDANDNYDKNEYYLTSELIAKFDVTNTRVVKIELDDKIKNLQILWDSELQNHFAKSKLVFEHNPKHDTFSNPRISFLSKDVQSRCQSILETSLIDETNPHNGIRYGYDSVTETYLKFREHLPNKFHAYPVEFIESEIPSAVRKKLN